MDQNTKIPLPHNPPRTCSKCGNMKFFPKGAPVNMKKCECDKKDNSPKIENSMDAIYEKALDWVANGSTGLSSKTMWSCLMGVKKFQIWHPHDPDDFSRCYKLLEHIPEWKSNRHMRQLKRLSIPWSNLVDNWDKLTQMYEQNEKEKWENSKKIGMFELMQKLIS